MEGECKGREVRREEKRIFVRKKCNKQRGTRWIYRVEWKEEVKERRKRRGEEEEKSEESEIRTFETKRKSEEGGRRG